MTKVVIKRSKCQDYSNKHICPSKKMDFELQRQELKDSIPSIEPSLRKRKQHLNHQNFKVGTI